MTLQQTVNQLKDSFSNGINRTYQSRKNHLTTLRTLVVDHEKELCDAIKADFGKPYFEAYATEILTVINEIDVHLKHLSKWMTPENAGNTITTFPAKSMIYKQPYGTVLILGAWNYPVHLTLMPLIGALSAGNTVVLKPSELAVTTSALLSKLFHQYFKQELVTVVEGGAKISQDLLKQPFDKIFFTGSTRVGKIVMKAAAEQLIPVTLELGGKSPAIISEDANISVSAKRIWWGKVMNAGQTCVAPDFVAIPESLKKSFITESKKVLSDFFKNDYQIGENYTSIINVDHFDRLSNLINQSKVLLGGLKNRDTLFIEPTLIESDWDEPIMEEEIFGPLLPVVVYQKTDDLIQKLNSKSRPLALYIFSDDQQFQDQIIQNVPFGGGCINETITHLSNHHLPFGGVGNSGMGSYHGLYSFETFSRKQSVLKKGFWPDPEFRYPPYEESKLSWLKRLFE